MAAEDKQDGGAWVALADRLDALAGDMFDQAPAAPDERDAEIIRLWSLSLRHCAVELRFIAGRD